MVLKFSETVQLSLGSSAELPQQALALTLSDDVLEDMIECIQNGQEIQLSLGDAPTFLYGDHQYQIPQSSSPLAYDLFYSDNNNPKSLERLPNPTMPILSAPRARKPLPKRSADDKAKAKPLDNKTRGVAGKAAAGSTSSMQADIEMLSQRLAEAEAEKLGNQTKIINGTVRMKGGKISSASTARVLNSQPTASANSHPGSPALLGIGSPSLNQQSAQEKLKRLRFPLIHELAVRERAFNELLPKWQEQEQDEESDAGARLHVQLEKIATFDSDLQKWALNQRYYKDLDVFRYPYESEEDRQKAIDNAIRHFDRMRLSVGDPVWQLLLPKAERGQGICLSRVQAAIAKGPTAPAPRINIQKADASSPSGQSENSQSDTSTSDKAKGGEAMVRSNSGNKAKGGEAMVRSNSGNKAKGGEPMARSNSGNKPKKLTESQAQVKRLMSNKQNTPSAKASPKVSPTKPTGNTAKAAATTKGGRILSKEFISDSDSDSSEEAPLSTHITKSRATASKPKPVERPAEKEKPRPVEKRDLPVPKPKPAARPTLTPKVMDSIRAEVVAKPMRPLKRSRDDDDDSSSSGTPLSKRFKAKDSTTTLGNKAPITSTQSTQSSSTVKHRKSDVSSQNSRSSGISSTTSTTSTAIKAPAKTSPIKSSPLASSPPTNASDLDQRGTSAIAVVSKNRKRTSAMSRKEREVSYDKEKNESSDSSGTKVTKRVKLSPELMTKATKFKAFYDRYEALHKEIVALEDPPQEKIDDLLDMRNRLSKMKSEIYREVGEEYDEDE